MTSIEKLDSVLEYFSNIQIENKYIREEDILLHFNNKVVQGRDELLKILKKLEKDEYLEVKLRSVNNNYNNPIPHYILTFEGDYFIRYEGGYLGKVNKNLESERLLEYYRELQSSQSRKLNILTRWIAIGTIIAAVYYIGEIFNTWVIPHL